MDPSYLALKMALGEHFEFLLGNTLEENDRLYELGQLTAEDVNLFRYDDFYFEWVVFHYPEKGYENVKNLPEGFKNWREVAKELGKIPENLSLNLDVIRVILLKTAPKDVPALCASSKKFEQVCRDKKFQKEYSEKWNISGLLPWQKVIANRLIDQTVEVLFEKIYKDYTGKYTNINELKKDIKNVLTQRNMPGDIKKRIFSELDNVISGIRDGPQDIHLYFEESLLEEDFNENIILKDIVNMKKVFRSFGGFDNTLYNLYEDYREKFLEILMEHLYIPFAVEVYNWDLKRLNDLDYLLEIFPEKEDKINCALYTKETK